ncbi:hypothetical protein HUN58_04585 [Curtobacterium sp. Csp1]|uniref:Transcriptional regulator, AbiEi antitoxin, Type IV TA system n=1 Tax=Curtobacterium citreum TaxID=2036 RepID=A0ABT2HGF1_9MICO|nr:MULTISPECIES: hypothetical protein [Curtobacterium]MCS6522347.1 hypothetical protein [Curtobacterium citreum]QKS13064.1 hypothetical protein HUN60_07870 [Curtobacterium sp. csp3]QKS19290.1 hypothetical protein HUN58_04585 [Curtobacterium sp. Csp1]TQJ29475.1 hypothetical protein FB462_3397 [Curtobacterium citreum]
MTSIPTFRPGRPVVVRRPADLADPVRLFHGAAVERREWEALDALGRRQLVVRSRIAALQRRVVASHRSAGALWGLPELGRWDSRLHVVDPGIAKTHVGRGVVRHAGQIASDEIAELSGTPVTSLLRTVTDIAHTVPLRHGVVVLDHVLHTGHMDRPALQRAFDQRAGRRGNRVARSALDLADAASESPGESSSRVTMRDLRVPPPILQQEFATDAGRFRVDFWWPDVGVVGEFDGRVKYDDRDVLWAEKRREDALRRLPQVSGFARWGMREAGDPVLLAHVLLAAGVPLGRGWAARPR